MRANILYSAGTLALLIFGTSSYGALAQDTAAAAPGQVVSTCEIDPDGISGNCPPTVADHFGLLQSRGATADALNSDVAATAIALAERGQRAEAENNIPLCIDLSQGILRTAEYSTDPAQQETIRQLATFMCCVRIEGEQDGLYFGTTAALATTGTLEDGATEAGGLAFNAPSAAFVADGVLPGDILVIKSGASQGYYVIASVDGENALTVQQSNADLFAGFSGSETDVQYEIRRQDKQYAENTCTPGFVTAAIPIVPAPQASPQ